MVDAAKYGIKKSVIAEMNLLYDSFEKFNLVQSII